MKQYKIRQRHYNRKGILAVVLVGALGISCYHPVLASVIKNAESKKNQAQENLDEINNQISNIHAAQNSLQAEMNKYDNELMTLLTDMSLLEEDMETQQAEIEEADAALNVAKAEEESQYNAMKQRIQYMYENGNQSFLTTLIESDNIVEFMNRVEYISEVYQYDRDLLTDYQATVAEVEDLTVQLNNEMEEMEELQISYQEQQSSLENIIAEKSAQMSSFNTQLANAQSLASQYAQTIREQNKVIEKEKARQAAEAKKKEEEAKKKKKNETVASNGGSSTSPETNSSETISSETASTGTGTTTAPGGGNNGLTDSGSNPSYTTGVSGSDVVSYATKFLGAPYVYGGNSLTNGTDCSYFVMAVFQNFGISLPRSSYGMQSCGQAVSYENARAGDIICYPGHVAIYMGNGQIIHASTPRTGVCYGTATYRTISTIRRVL